MGDLGLAGVPRAVHSALLYVGMEQFLAGVTGFVEAGLEQGEPVLAVLHGQHTGELRERLDGRDQEVSWADITRVGANPARIIPRMRRFISAHPGRGIRCVQEPIWAGRTAAERREAIRHEALINLAFAGTEVSVLCPYDIARLEPAVITCAGLAHPVLIRDQAAQRSPGYDAAAVFPAECDRPLRAPPGRAVVLAYRADLAAVREFTAVHVRGMGMSPDRARDLVLAVSELAANTLQHTSAGGFLTIWAARGELICQVADTGHISDPLAGRYEPDPRAHGGHGIWLVQQLCDLAELRTGPGGTVIRLHMRQD
jgi:anti-sigma regulatory factor (Ser/Thr protein kinase)